MMQTKKIGALLENISDEEFKKFLIDETPIEEGSGRVVNYLFKRFSGFIPAFKYSADCKLSLDLIRREWAFALRESDVRTLEQLNYGIHNLRKKGSIFLPSVGEFIAMCRQDPQELGIPHVIDAYKEACANAHPWGEKTWSHVVVYNAAKSTGFFELTNKPERESRPLFEYNYGVTVNRFINGERLDDIPKAIEHKADEPTSRAPTDIIKNLIQGLKQ